MSEVQSQSGNMADWVNSRIEQINSSKGLPENNPSNTEIHDGENILPDTGLNVVTTEDGKKDDKPNPFIDTPAPTINNGEDKDRMPTQAEMLSEMNRDMQKDQESRSAGPREDTGQVRSSETRGSLRDIPKEKATKAKEKTPSEEIKEAKDMAEALQAFNKNKGFDKPGLMGELAAKCAEFGDVESAMKFTTLAVETNNSLRITESTRMMGEIVGGFESSINRMRDAIANGVTKAEAVTGRLAEVADINSRAASLMHYNNETFSKSVDSMKMGISDFNDSVGRMRNSGY